MTQDTAIDLSSYQKGAILATAQASGIRFADIKATEGTGTDSCFAGFLAQARALGLARSAYHFLHHGDIAAQAAHYLDVVRPPPGSIISLDYEMEKGRTDPTADEAQAWREVVEQQSGATVMLYSYQSFLDAHVPVGHPLATAPLWLARVGMAPRPHFDPSYQIGALPKAWASRPADVLLWQYSWTGRVPGVIPGVSVDVDRSVGDIEALIARYPGCRS